MTSNKQLFVIILIRLIDIFYEDLICYKSEIIYFHIYYLTFMMFYVPGYRSVT